MGRRRRRTPTHQLSISATDREWELVRERAEARELTIARYLVECGLTVELAQHGQEPAALVLKDEEQRDLLENVARVAERLESGTRPLVEAIEEARELLAFVFRATALDMVRQGRADEMREILRDVFGEEHAQALARQIDDWAREPESLR